MADMAGYSRDKARAQTVKVKTATTGEGDLAKPVHFTMNGSDGQIIHFDANEWAEPAAKEPTILLSDYRRFLKAGLIERSDEAETMLTEGSDIFVPAGQVVFQTTADFARAVDEIVMRRLAGMQEAEDSVERTTGLSGKATTAYPANQPVGQIEGEPSGFVSDDDDTPPPARRGRPPKVAAPVAEDAAES